MFFKKKTDDYIENFDGQKIYNLTTGEFVMDFNDEQKKILKKGMDERRWVGAIAYPEISASVMRNCMPFLAPCIMLFNAYDNVRAIDVWKVAHVFTNPDECRIVLRAMTHKVDVFKEFKDVRTLSSKDLLLIYESALKDVNACKYIKRGLSEEEIKRAVNRNVRRRNKWNQFYDVFIRLRNPEEF